MNVMILYFEITSNIINRKEGSFYKFHDVKKQNKNIRNQTNV